VDISPESVCVCHNYPHKLRTLARTRVTWLYCQSCCFSVAEIPLPYRLAGGAAQKELFFWSWDHPSVPPSKCEPLLFYPFPSGLAATAVKFLWLSVFHIWLIACGNAEGSPNPLSGPAKNKGEFENRVNVW